MRRSAFICLLLAVALAGCGTKTLQEGQVEDLITKEIAKVTGKDGVKTTCPSDVEVKEGKTFDCDVKGADGSAGKAPVVIDDTSGEKPHVSFDAPVVHTTELETSITAAVQQQTGGVPGFAPDCPDVQLAKKGDQWDCKAKWDDGTGTVAVTYTAEGDKPFDFRLTED